MNAPRRTEDAGRSQTPHRPRESRLTVYAHCIDGQDQITNRLIEHALRPASRALCPKASGSANRRYRPDPVRTKTGAPLLAAEARHRRA